VSEQTGFSEGYRLMSIRACLNELATSAIYLLSFLCSFYSIFLNSERSVTVAKGYSSFFSALYLFSLCYTFEADSFAVAAF